MRGDSMSFTHVGAIAKRMAPLIGTPVEPVESPRYNGNVVPFDANLSSYTEAARRIVDELSVDTHPDRNRRLPRACDDHLFYKG